MAQQGLRMGERQLEEMLARVTKPGRYVGGEWNQVRKPWETASVRVALAFPDIYEIGMSNLGLAILYDILNREPDVLAERCYVPWVDMEAEIRAAGAPLWTLESHRPLRDFDVVGISVPYEQLYTNVLNLLDLAGIPLRSDQRAEGDPLVLVGGGSATNPEPMADFYDAVVVGEGEEAILDVVAAVRRWKADGVGRSALLRRLAGIAGVYVPSLYTADEGGVAVRPRFADVPERVARRVVRRLPPPPVKPVVPHLDVVHNRATLEIQRGCTRGCRFCHAGFTYRPVRERPLEEIVEAVEQLVRNTGYDELALVSLSSSDYRRIGELVQALRARYAQEYLSVSLP
ncbi:MAG: radical SAM protein, partial [Chloroflexi bacterium]|nr:radical SAM protein [Chloroflexota bacterium]